MPPMRHRSLAAALGATMALLAFTAAGPGAAAASAATPAATDVMFVFDTSGSMNTALEEAKSQIAAVMAHLSATLPNVDYGVAEVRDFGGSEYDPEPEIVPWRLDQAVTSNATAVSEAISRLSAFGGGDPPEAYGRALWETDTNPTVGWRRGARHLIVLVADQVPHNPNLDEGIPEADWASPSPWNTGEELPGTWGIPDTQLKEGEKLDFHAVLHQLASDGKPLEMVDYYDNEGDYVHYWETWAAISGGQALEAHEGANELPGKLGSIIETGAVAAAPECPAGLVRNENGECAAAPPPPPPPPPVEATTDNGLGAPTPTCANHSIALPGGITVEASCFTVGLSGTLHASGHIRVNGLDLVLSGSGGFTLDPHKLTLDSSAEVDAYAGSLHIYHGTLSWKFNQKLELGVPKSLKIKGLPVSGNAALSLAPGGLNVAVNATVGKSPYKVSGAIDLKLKLATGLELSSFRLELASDLPIKSLVVHKASLAYKHEGSNDVWTGAVEVELPPKGPTVSGKLVVTNGSISTVALDVSGINKPLGEVVFLQSLGLEVSFSPKLVATGSIGLSAGPAVDGKTAASLEGSLTAEIGEPFVLDAKGKLKLVEQELAEAEIKATIPGGVAFNGKLTASFLVITLEGHVKGEVTSHSFYAEGGITLHAPVVSANGDGLVNNTGIAGCASAEIGVTVFGHFIGKTVTVGGSHRWSGENHLFTDSCGFGRLRSALGAAVAGSGTAISVPPHTRQLNLIVRGSAGPPELTLTQGSTSALVTPNSTGAFGHTVYLAIADPT
ncbi:MAG: vWA domain-containing protein, partial [Solirubrobacteraceae bacterium]